MQGKFRLKAATALVAVLFTLIISTCHKYPELYLSEIKDLQDNEASFILNSTLSKPYQNQDYTAGRVGGQWQDAIISEPKTFNQVLAERDSSSSSIVALTLDYLVDYNSYTKTWTPHAATYEIEVDKEKDTLTVHYTLKDNLYWTYYNKDYSKEEKIKVTSDDYVYWYNEIAGDIAFNSSGYAQQQVSMADGSVGHIDCIKVDERRFDFIFPRIIADPLLSTNMSCCPSFLYRAAKEKGGVEEVRKLFSIDTDPVTLPSCGKYYITKYVPGQRLEVERNPYYHERDKNGVSIPYPKKKVFKIIGDLNTEYLLFKEGKMETYSPPPENIKDVIKNKEESYTVFRAGGSLSVPFISFNQNKKNKEAPYYKWFTLKEFRQAFSMIINRQRIINQTYRGLAEAKYDFFPPPNPYYNKEIELEYKYNPEEALKKLKEKGFTLQEGFLFDKDKNKVEFSLIVPSTAATSIDMAGIISDEARKVGITVNIRQVDFQKVVEMLSVTYEWEAVIISLGSTLFPSQGSNVWPSYGNLHLWNPLQRQPETSWEASLDYLYNEGCYTIDKDKAFAVWDEYQRLILEECPIIYLVSPKTFLAIRNRWDLSNAYYDNINGADTERLYLRLN